MLLNIFDPPGGGVVACMVMEVRFLQPLNTEAPRLSTLAERITEVKPEQELNAPFSRVAAPSMTRFSNALHAVNADSSMLVTLFGRVRPFNTVQL